MSSGQSGSGTSVGIEVQGGLLELVAVGDEAADQIYEVIARATMADVLELADVLEIVEHGLDERACAAVAASGSTIRDHWDHKDRELRICGIVRSGAAPESQGGATDTLSVSPFLYTLEFFDAR